MLHGKGLVFQTPSLVIITKTLWTLLLFQGYLTPKLEAATCVEAENVTRQRCERARSVFFQYNFRNFMDTFCSSKLEAATCVEAENAARQTRERGKKRAGKD